MPNQSPSTRGKHFLSDVFIPPSGVAICFHTISVSPEIFEIAWGKTGTQSVNINWGDESGEDDITGDVRHTFLTEGEKFVTMTVDDLNTIQSLQLFYNDGDGGYFSDDLVGIFPPLDKLGSLRSLAMRGGNPAIHSPLKLHSKIVFDNNTGNLFIPGCNFAGDFPDILGANGAYCDASSNKFSRYIPGPFRASGGWNHIELQNNLFPRSSVDAILHDVVLSGVSNGILKIDGTGNNAPSLQGLNWAAILRSRGWEVDLNEPTTQYTAIIHVNTAYMTDQTATFGINKTGETMHVSWGDGNQANTGTGVETISHRYSVAGQYVVTLSSPLDGWEGLLTLDISNGGAGLGGYGTLPSFAFCRNLTHFDCGMSHFSGVLPSFNACTALAYFDCYANMFSGELPSFEACVGLNYFYCYGNQFSGPLPSFSVCPALVDFNCSTNQFSDELPSFELATGLLYFDCSGNRFSGVLKSFAACLSLSVFWCNGNSFSGELPSFAANVALDVLGAYNNAFTGSAVGSFATQKDLGKTSPLDLRGNLLTESVVDQILAELVSSLALEDRAVATVALEGGNAAPSDLDDVNTLTATPTPGWTVTVTSGS